MSDASASLAVQPDSIAPPLVERVTDPEAVNRVINNPSVLPWVRGSIEGPLDSTPVLADPRNIALFGQHGGIVFTFVQSGVYEAHTQVLPEGRGPWALQMAQAALLWLFAGTEAVEVLTRAPHGNLGALALAKAVHGELEFTNQKGWVLNGEVVPADIYSLPIQRWMRTAPNLIERGRWFHDALKREYRRLGRLDHIHDDDDVHDRYVGVAVEMILAGQAVKGVMLYNRWAAFAGYAPVQIVNLDPLMIDISEAVLLVERGTFRVIRCR
jgi:hypothetical protein